MIVKDRKIGPYSGYFLVPKKNDRAPWICAQLTQALCGTNAVLYAHLEEILGPSLVREVVHLKDADSHLKAEKNPPSILHAAVVPLYQCVFVCDLCLFYSLSCTV